MALNIQDTPIDTLTKQCVLVNDFLLNFGFETESKRTFRELLATLEQEFWETHSTNEEELTQQFVGFVKAMQTIETRSTIHSLEVVAGIDKSGDSEQAGFVLKPGEVTCVVGPTGSGKSRLLADIEWLAEEDTPTKRTIRINGEVPSEELKQSHGGKLIAQITQNMNFVLDMDVESFLMLHAQSRMIANAQERVDEVIALANDLSGESFERNVPVTFLSGGQSRALMIADVACIGEAPIVLIDEIENAGVDKRKALDLLTNKEKIVLMATHDPLLILQADKRIVIENGGIKDVIETTPQERRLYDELNALDKKLQHARNFFRKGKKVIEEEAFSFATLNQ